MAADVSEGKKKGILTNPRFYALILEHAISACVETKTSTLLNMRMKETHRVGVTISTWDNLKTSRLAITSLHVL